MGAAEAPRREADARTARGALDCAARASRAVGRSVAQPKEPRAARRAGRAVFQRVVDTVDAAVDEVAERPSPGAYARDDGAQLTRSIALRRGGRRIARDAPAEARPKSTKRRGARDEHNALLFSVARTERWAGDVRADAARRRTVDGIARLHRHAQWTHRKTIKDALCAVALEAAHPGAARRIILKPDERGKLSEEGPHARFAEEWVQV